MGKPVIGFPIYSDTSVSYTPVLSGGSWLAALPLANLANRELAKVARSSDDALTSTRINYDLAVARAVRLIGIPVHNFSTAAKIRGRVWSAAPIFDDTAFDTWTAVGTPTETTGQTDPFGGTRAVLLGDDDAAVAEAERQNIIFTGDGVKAFGITLKAGTAGVTEFGVYDNTAGVWKHRVRATWSGGVPTLSTVAGSGTLYAVQLIATGFYACFALCASLTAASDNEFWIYPAGETAGNTGNVTAYEALAWDLTTQPVLYDSGVVDAWPSGVTVEDADGLNVGTVLVLSAAQTARYGRLEIADTANADTYVELGRLCICGGYQPTYDPDVGLTLGFESETTRAPTDGGAFLYRERRRRRVVGMRISNLALTEALGTPFRMGQRVGSHGQFYFVRDPDDATQLHKWSFLATQREIPTFGFPYYHRAHWPVTLVEEL